MYVVRPNITGIMSSVNGSALFHEGMLLLEEFTLQLELTCEAYGIPPPEVTWIKDGIALQNLPGRRIITAENGGSLGELGNLTRSTLSLTEVQLSDAGEYTCRAISGNVSPIPGTTAWTFMFEVTRELLILVKMLYIRLHELLFSLEQHLCKFILACIMHKYVLSTLSPARTE